jgi:hypothetical protein
MVWTFRKAKRAGMASPFGRAADFAFLDRVVSCYCFGPPGCGAAPLTRTEWLRDLDRAVFKIAIKSY